MIISPRTILHEIPLSGHGNIRIHQYRETIAQILQGVDSRKILIVGPCSIHDINGALKYAKKLYTLSQEVKDTFFIVMRTYVEKSRTILGWKGLLSDPARDGSSDILAGIRLTRTFLRELTDIGLPAGLEFLDPLTSNYIKDLISWGSIGARTVQSQIHRQLASSLPMPIGFKNTTDGNILHAVHAALVSHHPHTFLTMNLDGRLEMTTGPGNILPHIVLRGGLGRPNYDSASILEALALLEKAKLTSGLLIDCSHDNSGGNPTRQKNLFCHLVDEVLPQHKEIRGLMLESYLTEGSQKYGSDNNGEISITDPCLDWDTTESLIKYAHTSLNGINSRNTSCKLNTFSVP